MKLTSMSAIQTHVKIVGDVLMHLIDTTACVLMASMDSTVRTTLMNACQRLAFMGGTCFFLHHLRQKHCKLCRNGMKLFLITLLASTSSGDICHVLYEANVMHLKVLSKLKSLILLKRKYSFIQKMMYFTKGSACSVQQ